MKLLLCDSRASVFHSRGWLLALQGDHMVTAQLFLLPRPLTGLKGWAGFL